ncbi:thioredoxin family protein [Staphylococcus caprae]|mgnify:CR=1 FL=1|uniref:Thioredoxin domain protein n=1 Tax=Staphylococcus caprae TaxID=29380 RepID=A0ABN5W3D9_9STAP|nr:MULTISPECIES: thioredoxin family protein [Staphylococcus]EES39887.1 thioredoxin [Staphylococcus caprae M23864:W1]MBN6825876.1 thioredoxin family protein [Staphylococcus caprae]MBX5315858.1 thioredoxin family protein [Staphylococcus caprae]MBX5322816.1 thioredoxin family protein [Staphylococcus caprae]MDI0014106.1 thioredoxin family protein [Staphylococcus caprae]
MKQLESEKQFEELKQGKTVFEFTAGWCPDCRVIEPDLPKLEEKYQEFDFVSVDRDQFIDLCIDNDILGIPSFLVFKEGELLGSYIGKERKSIEQIDEFLAQHI